MFFDFAVFFDAKFNQQTAVMAPGFSSSRSRCDQRWETLFIELRLENVRNHGAWCIIYSISILPIITYGIIYEYIYIYIVL